MQAQATPQDSATHLTLATWVLALHAAGVPCADEAMSAACEQLMGGEGDAQALVDAVAASFPGGTSPQAVAAVAGSLYPDRVRTDLGEGARAERLKAIRARQFGRSLPWLARIFERHEDGCVAPTWLLIQSVTDVVLTMDPNPWNDIDEARQIPVSDFQVLWELDACASVAVR